MNSSVWDVWAQLAVRKKSGFEFFWATFEGVFFNFLRAKKMNFFWKHCRKFPHFFDIFDDFVYCWTFEILHLHVCLLLNLWTFFTAQPLRLSVAAEPLRLCPGLCICLLLNLWNFFYCRTFEIMPWIMMLKLWERSAVNKITKKVDP